MGKARMNAYKDRIAETERVKERQRAACDSTLLIAAGYMNMQEDMHRGENLR